MTNSPNKMAPDIVALLQQNIQKNAANISEIPLSEVRNAYIKIGKTFGAKLEQLYAIDNKKIDIGETKIDVRFYQPLAVSEKKTPIIVYIHGGGWVFGNLESHDPVCRRLAKLSNCVVLAINYRLAPEFSAPTGPNDVLAVLNKLDLYQDEYNLDLNKIAIMGDSAGGSLAAVAALHLRGTNVKISSQILFYPSVDVSPESWSYLSRQENKDNPPLTLNDMSFCIKTFLGTFDPYNFLVSPLLANNHENLPPALIFTGSCDVLRDDGYYYFEKLKQNNNKVEYHELDGMVHGFIEMLGALPSVAWTMDKAIEFILENFPKDK